jgi:TonB-linked SusC/RagA family outer membrane protein
MKINNISKKINPNLFSIMVSLLTFFLLPQYIAAETQNKITLSANSTTLKAVFDEIEKQTNLFVDYEESIIDINREINISVVDMNLDDALNLVLKNSGYTYSIKGNHIILSQQPQQNIDNKVKITGTVTDAQGIPVIGANIIEKGTTNGAITDIDGSFSLEVRERAVLSVTYIGYTSREISIGNQRILAVQLAEDTQALDEVVVVGYGVQKKANLTGAVASVSGEKMAKRPVSSTSSMLQGMMSGVQVMQSSGEPGAENGINIQIRGKGTFSSAGSAPLVLINGIQGNLESVNPNDIESVSILKDAASAAIYGSQAANGVILVTTKSGTAGKMSIEVRANYSMKYPTFLWNLITNSAEYMELFNEASINSRITDPNILYSQETINLYRNPPAGERYRYPNTDWLDIMFNPAPTQNYYVSFKGGTDKTQYNVSLDYLDDQGILKGYNYGKYHAMINLNSQISERIKLTTAVNFNATTKTGTNEGATDQVIATLSQTPLYEPKHWDGSGHYIQKAFTWEYVNKNPVAQVEQRKRYDHRYAADGQLGLDVKLLKGLLWSTKGGFNVNFNRYDYFAHAIDLYNWNSGLRVSKGSTGGATREYRQNTYLTLFSQLAYEGKIGNNHNLSALMGYSMEENTMQFVRGGRRNYETEILTEINAGSQEVQTATGNKEDWALMSYYGRMNYNYKERYLFEINMRYDGSSRLSPASRWVVFPSFSGAWRITEEDFIKNLDWRWMNNIKLRGGYGKLGNQNIGLYPYQALLNLTSYSYDNQSLSVGTAQSVLNNPQITWEKTSMLDIALELGLFNGFSISLDWYKKRTSDILRGSQLTGVVGLQPPTVNNGTMENTGIDIDIAYNRQIKSGFFKGLNYNIAANIEHYKNKLVDFGEREIGDASGANYFIKQEGEEYDAFYMLEWIGIFQSKEEIANSPKQFMDETIPGDLKWKDANGDGKIDNDDRVVLSGRYPKFNYGLNLSANWKSFDLYTLFQGVHGIKFFLEKWAIVPFSQGSPPTVQWRDRWTEENPSTTMPRMYYQGWDSAPQRLTRPNSWFLRDASYFRLKNLTLGYTLPSNLTKRTILNQVRVFFSGDNLFTITKHRDLDPERTTNGYNANYTQNKIFSLGLDIQF